MTDAPADTAAERARLLAKRDELRARIASIRNDIREGLDADSAERALQLENREVLEAIARAAVEDLARIEARLAELGRGPA